VTKARLGDLAGASYGAVGEVPAFGVVIVVPSDLNWVSRPPPSADMPPIAATAISAARRPYSIAVAPLVFFRSERMVFIIVISFDLTTLHHATRPSKQATKQSVCALAAQTV